MQQRYDIVRSVVFDAVGAVNATPSKSEDQIRDATRDLIGRLGDAKADAAPASFLERTNRAAAAGRAADRQRSELIALLRATARRLRAARKAAGGESCEPESA